MNDTYELYKSGGNLVAQCNAEMEDELPLASRLNKVEPTQEYVDFCNGLIRQCKGIMSEDRARHGTIKAAVARCNACQDQIDPKEIDLLKRLIEISEIRIKQNKELVDTSVYFLTKIARNV